MMCAACCAGPPALAPHGTPRCNGASLFTERSLLIRAQQTAGMVLKRLSGAPAGVHGSTAPLSSQQHARPACPCCRARPDHASTSDSDSYAYNSGSSAGQCKATIEHVYREKSSGGTGPPGPWQMGWQMSERNLVWNDDLKARLLKMTVKKELGLDDAEADDRLIQLANLLPGLLPRLPTIKAKTVVTLAQDITRVAQKLMEIKAVFPEADASSMFLQRPLNFLATDAHAMEEGVAGLQSILPEVNIHRLVSEHPQVLDVQSFELAIKEAKHIMPDMNVSHMMRMNPSMIFSFQRGDSLIPYDEVPTS